ncbi:right-handed parallel beta-helix repeat-containing protein [Halovulum dunhuangense]|uniref:Right-handed parallel beta-helix repeat-containing protein n=1 Tax=Halovulum dunhuangense TaxID=1505036 RepID=A0A849L3Y6_9RHOB|nr:glycosyl hydrolase family 28-related protein [Halovulum dunhuangense]NNU80914.1 right-handed parallel beta-helix repeat-containing protein [Halovulum dunhuangense]
MNMAITDGLDLMPPDFVEGLHLWSSGDGTTGSPTYATDPSGSLVASDPDFGDCLEIVTAANPQRLRHMGETPILPGTYLEIAARVKLIAGPSPQVRIAAFAGDANGVAVTSVPLLGPVEAVSDYGRVVTVRAIVGSGHRTGVDMVWGTAPVFGHFGLNISGGSGSVLRIESIRVEDVTSVFHRKMIDAVDVMDYGARGDGITNDATAFETADAAAAGRVVIVPKGSYLIDRNVTMTSPMRFEGTVVQPENRRLVLRGNFDYAAYLDAFGDETLALKKALQALFNFTDHDTLDLCGRTINLTGPIDVAAAVNNSTFSAVRRVIRNGHILAEPGPAWTPDVVGATASYAAADPLRLTDVTDVGAIAVGSLVEGFGVGREVYVRSRDVAAGTLTLSQPLCRAAGRQAYTFTRFKYLLDFSGFQRINRLTLEGVQFEGAKEACGILMSDLGTWWAFRNCWFMQTGMRGITSHGEACQGLTIESCEMIASDADELVQDRRSVGFNTNKNDAKIRNNRGINFRHWGVLSGNGNLILGNHFWQLDPADPGERTAGLVLTDKKSKTTITGNYIDTQFIEFTNEHQAGAASANSSAFGQVTIIGNIFTATQVPDWFRFLVWSPIGSHRLEGVTVIGNSFQLFGGSVIDRVEAVDTSLGGFDMSQTKAVVFSGNTYGEVAHHSQSPALIEASRGSAATSWTVDASGKLPFGCRALGVDGVTAHGPLLSSGGAVQAAMPHVLPATGAGGQSVTVVFPTAVRGTVQVRVRADHPS